MVLKGISKVKCFGNSSYFLIPSSIMSDSNFPFILGEELEIEIKNKQVIICPKKKKKK